MLIAVANALSAWSASVSRAAQQSTQSTQQDAALLDTPFELSETGYWLLLAAGCLLLSMRDTPLCNMVDERQLLDTLGRFIVRVLTAYNCYLLHNMLSSSHPANLLRCLQTTGHACQDDESKQAGVTRHHMQRTMPCTLDSD